MSLQVALQIIFAMESAFAAIIGWFAGENLGLLGLVGSARYCCWHLVR